MVVFGQGCCIRQKWLFSGNVVVFGQKCLYWDKTGCIRAKVVVFIESACIRAMWFYSCKVVVFGQKWLYSDKVDFFR